MKEMLSGILNRFNSSSAKYMKIDFGWRKFIEFEKKEQLNNNSSVATVFSSNSGSSETATVSENSREVVSRYVGRFLKKKDKLKEGETVVEGEVLGTIESMGIAHEIVVLSDGILEEVMIKDGDIVEYEQILFRIKGMI